MKNDDNDIVTIDDIKDAAKEIADVVSPTLLKKSEGLSKKLGHEVYLKLENLNTTGSFKIRGATNALRKNKTAAQQGVVASSAGNHAQGVAFICRLEKVPATIFMPENASYKKKSSTEAMGAKVILSGRNYQEAFEASQVFHKKYGGMFLHPFALPEVVAGQGTIGLELLDCLKEIDAVIVPIGGGGLISGIACCIKALSPKTKVIGVQTMYYPAMQNKFAHLAPNLNKEGTTLADGIAVKNPSDFTYSYIEKYVDDIVLVSENEMTSTILSLMESDQILAEGAGVAATAGLIGGRSEILKKLPKNSKIVSIVSGGNIDIGMVSKVVARGLYMSGRLMRLRIKVQDQPGSLLKLLSVFSGEGINILEVSHNRIFSDEEAFVVECCVDVETVNNEQQDSVKLRLKECGYLFSVG